MGSFCARRVDGDWLLVIEGKEVGVSFWKFRVGSFRWI
jgi:hypothetical protein